MFRWRTQFAILLLAVTIVFGGAFELRAVAPNNIVTYQGRVLSTNGVPVSDASLSMKFFLYTASSGGTCVWSNSSSDCHGNTPASTTARSVSLSSGLFTQNLGDASDSFATIADSTFADNATLYLEVIIGSETLSPRKILTAAPYALNAQSLDGLSSADFNLDRIYDNDSDSTLAVDGASGLTFTNSGTANVIFNLSSTGDFAVQDNGVVAVTITDGGVLDVDGGVLLGDGGDTIAIDSSDWDITTAGTMTGIGAITMDGLLTGTAGATLSGAIISLNASSNFATNINTGTSTGVVSIGNSASAVSITSNTLSLTDDNWSVTSSGAATFASLAATSVSGNLDLSNNLLLNIGNSGTDFTSGGGLTLAGDLTISGDDLAMATNTSGFILVADGTNFNPVAVSGDATLSGAGTLAITSDAVALTTDTTGNYVATIADSGNSTVSITNGTAEGGAATINVIGIDCSDCLGAAEIADSYLFNNGDTGTGDYIFTGTLDLDSSVILNQEALVFEGLTSDDYETSFNITNPTDSDKTITFPNSSGTVILSGHTFTSDVTGTLDTDGSTALTIASDSVALTTDTTGNYVATIADSGAGDFTIVNGVAEGGAVTIDIADDVLDFAEFENSLEVDEATDINVGANLFSIDLDSTGDFAIRDGTTNLVLFEDNSTIDIAFPAAGFLTVDATSSTTTSGVIDMNVTTGDAAVDGFNVSLTQSDGATSGTDATALEVLLTGNDADGDMFGLTITGAATANAGAGTYESLLSLINNENTVGAVSDAIRIASGASTSGSIATGLDFDTTDIAIDIEFQNDETLDNNTDGVFTFTRNTDAGVTIMAADSSGAANLTIDTTSTGTITVGSSDVTSVSLVTDNNAAGDVSITGGLTVTSGATHNSFTITSSADTESAARITADSITSGYGIDLSADALTTGTALYVQTTSTALTSGALATFRQDSEYTTSAPGTVTLSGRAVSVGQNPSLNGTGTLEVTGNAMKVMRTIENFSTGTITETGALLDVARSQANSGGGTFTVTGAVFSVSSDNDIAVTDSANVVSITQNNGGATGTMIRARNLGTGTGMHLVQDTIDTPAANDIDNQALVLDVNEANLGGVTTDAVFLIRSDADGTPDTEFRIEGDGDFMYDGTGSTPASDLAEVYPSPQALVPGDLVALDSSGNLSILKTTQTYQPNLFGAISTKPAVRMGAETIGYDVALVGRVPLKVSGENGAIEVGDPLTSSASAGCAMKATEAGMIVGYALDSFDSTGIGEVMAFINVGWFAGNVIGTDGTSTVATDNVVISQTASATSQSQRFDSFGLSLRGSAWGGDEAKAVEMILKNIVTDESDYRLSVRNSSQSEVAYITNEGTMRIAGDMVIAGRLYPSDRGVAQTQKYIYYDGSDGPAGDFMRTNAKGWSTGSYDFAEMFPSEEKLLAGELVVFIGESVARAHGAKDEQLAGVVSTRPGFLAGENLADSYPIALAGRVPVRVSAQNGTINVGDPLAASSIDGVAVRALKAGQIVGYALESYDGSQSDDLILGYVNVGYWGGEQGELERLIDNRASQLASRGATDFASLNMSGDISMGSHSILGIGKLEGIGSSWSLEKDGTFKTQGLMKTIVDSYQNKKVETVAVTSPEVVITLSGTARLENGIAEVRFEDVDPEFNDVISAIAPVRVFVTPSGPVSLYVSQKDQNHFVVSRFQGDIDAEFDWMVVGYRKGYEPEIEEDTQSEEEETTEIEQEEIIQEERDVETETDEELEANEDDVTPVSPDTNFDDQTTPGEGGENAEEPPEVVQDQLIDSLSEQ